MKKAVFILLSSVMIFLLSGPVYSQEGVDLVVGMRSGGSFTTSDVQGTWRFVGLVNLGTGINSADYFYGRISVNNFGQVTSGEYTHHGESGTFTDGVFQVASNARLSGSIVGDNSTTYTLVRGKIDINRNRIVSLYTHGAEFCLLYLFKDDGITYTCNNLAGAPWQFTGIVIADTENFNHFSVFGSISFTSAGTASGMWKDSTGGIGNIIASNDLCPNESGIF